MIYSKDERRLYKDLTWLWPVISPPEDYIEEAREYVRAIRQYARIEVKTMLDLGCGGGHNDHTLQEHYQVTGVDLSESMLTLARKLNPQVTYLVGDMRNVQLGSTFDAVLIADSIDYMLTEDDLRAAFATAYRHLNPGGVFCTVIEETPEHFKQNATTTKLRTRGVLEVTLIENYYDPDPTDTTYEMTFIYLIRKAGQLTTEIDHHLGGIFPLETWNRLMEEVGFEVKQVFSEVGVYPIRVGIKP